MKRSRRVPLEEIEVTIVPVKAPREEYERVWFEVLELIQRMYRDSSHRVSNAGSKQSGV